MTRVGAPKREVGGAPPPASLRARDLAVTYGRGEALRGVSLDIRRGQLVVVVGPNGAGKTTLLRALSGAIPPSRGTIELDGDRLSALSRPEIARRIAFVPQELPATEGFSVRDFAMMGRAPHQGRWLRAGPDDEAIVEEALARCGTSHVADRDFAALSGGERKRVVMAQALAQRASILLLDEPIAFLDLRHALDVLAIAREEAARGAAVVATIHDLAIASRIADLVVLVVAGELAAVGSVEDVMTEARLSAAFDVDIRRWTDSVTGSLLFTPIGTRGATLK